MEANLAGKVAIVTGASSGIGEEVARKLAQAGASVVIGYAGNKDKADAVAAELPTAEVLTVGADMGNKKEVRRLFREADARFHRLDILVLAASAPILDKDLLDTSDEEYDRVFAVNATGTFVALQEAGRRMTDGGRIVTFSTPYVFQPALKRSVTGGSKAASDHFALTLAKELGYRNITVNAVMPGPTDTPSFRSMVPPEIQQQVISQIPAGRLGQADDVAEVVLFLVSDAARWVNGQTLRVNGGML